MASYEKDNESPAPTTFKEAYGVLQRHAEALRRQQEPNIDELVNIVTESVNAYRVCKARIEAVEQALERTLGEAEADSVVAAGPQDNGSPHASASPERTPPKEEFDDDIPF